MTKLALLFRRLRSNQEGLAAVEFALIAPVLIFSLLASVDLGLAGYQRMALDHVVRSAAQAAMTDPGETGVKSVLQATASKNFSSGSIHVTTDPVDPSIGYTIESDPVNLAAKRFCACPDQADTAVTCSTSCSGTVPTYIYYQMSASKMFHGSVLPQFRLSTAVQVQAR